MFSRKIFYCLLFFSCILFSAIHAQTSYTWNGSTSGSWTTSSNWTPNGVPSSSDNVTIVSTGNNPVLGANTTVANFSISSGVLDINTYTLTTTGTGSASGGNVNNGTINFIGTSVTFSGTIFGAEVLANCGTLLFNGSTFNSTATLEKTGSGNDVSAGGNTFNGTTTITNSGSGYLLLSNSTGDTYNADVHYINSGTSLIYLSYQNNTTTNYNGNIYFNSTNGSGIRFGGYFGASVLASGKTISIGSSGFTTGSLILSYFTQVGSTAQSLTLTGTALLSLNDFNVFNGSVDFKSPRLYLKRTKFNSTTLLEKTGATGDITYGGCAFNGVTTISNGSTSTGYLYLTQSLPDTANSDITFVNLSSSELEVSYNSYNNVFNGTTTFNNLGSSYIRVAAYAGSVNFNGDVRVNSTSGSGVFFGYSGKQSVITLASGKTISIGNLGFTSGGLGFCKFIQTGNTSQNLTLTGTSYLDLTIGNVFNGNVDFKAPTILFSRTVFNDTTLLEKTGTTHDAPAGGNTFAELTTITNSGTGYLRMANNYGDTCKSSITFTKSGTGNLLPAYVGTNIYKANITVNSSSAISFGSGGGTVLLNGTAAQSINSSNASTSFKNLTVNNAAASITLNAPLAVTTTLTLTNGKIITTSTNLLTLSDNVSITGTSDNSFISGPVKKIGNDIFTFPIGKGSNYRPLSITAPSQTTDAFTAQYYSSGQTLGSNADASIAGNLSTCEYWQLDRTTGSSNITPALNWNTSSCNVVTPLSKMRVAGWNGTKWADLQNGGTTGNSSMGSVNTSSVVTTYGAFTLANDCGEVTISPSSSTICNGSSTTLTASGETDYTWSPSTGLNVTTGSTVVASPTTTITYTIIGTTSGGCSRTATVTVNVNPIPSVSVTPASATICNGSNTSLTASGATTYAWSPSTGLNVTSGASVVASPSASTTYTITGTTSGCSGITTANVTVNPIPSISVTPSSATLCDGNNTTITASGATTYAWSPSTGLNVTTGASVVANPSSSTTYTITGTTNGCNGTKTVTVNVPAAITLSLSATTSAGTEQSCIPTGEWEQVGVAGNDAVICMFSDTVTKKLYVGGSFTSIGGISANCIARYNGETWNTLGSGTNGEVFAITAKGSKVYVGGTFTLAGGVAVNNIAVYDTATTTWSSLGTGANSGVNALIFYNNELYAGGWFTTIDGVTVNGIARWDGSSWYALAGGVDGDGVIDGVVHACSIYNNKLFVAGAFSISGTVSANNISYWDGSQWHALTTGTDFDIKSLYVYNNQLYVGGAFATSGDTLTNGIAKWDGSSWSSVSTGTGNMVNSIVNDGSFLFLGGNFSYVGGEYDPDLGYLGDGLPVNNIASWNGSKWDSISSGFNGYINTLTKYNSIIYAGGAFQYSGNNPVAYIAKWCDGNLETKICQGSSATLTASGASNYTWSPATGLSATTGPSVIASPTASTIYTVTGFANGCSVSKTIYVKVNADPSLTISSSLSNICNGDSTILTAGGADTYIWSPSEGLSVTTGSVVTATPTASTTYTVVGSNQCGESIELITIIVDSCVQIPCLILNGGYITISGGSVTSPVFLVVNDNNTAGIKRLAAGGHIYTDGQYNFVKWNAEEEQGNYVFPFGVEGTAEDYIPFTFRKTSPESANITASTWHTNTQNIPHPGKSNVSAVYAMKGVGDSLTTAIDRFWDVRTSSATTADLTFSYRAIENTTDVPVDEIKIQRWSPSGCLLWSSLLGSGNAGANTGVGTVGPVTNVTSFSPFVAVRSAYPLLKSNSGGLTVNAGADNMVCSGVATTLGGSPTVAGGTSPYTYSWLPAQFLNNSTAANPVSTPTATTNYTLTVSDQQGCSVMADVNLQVAALTVNPASSATICAGDNIELTASGMSSYNWSPASSLSSGSVANPIAFPSSTTTYSVSAAHNSCSGNSQITVTVLTTPTLSVIADQEICQGQSVHLTATGTGNFQWSPATGLSNPSIADPYASPTSTTEYTVKLTSANACSTEKKVTVIIDNIPVIQLGGNTTICQGASLQLDAIAGAQQFQWTPATGLDDPYSPSPLATPTASTTYTVTAVNGVCSSVGSISIVVKKAPSAIFTFSYPGLQVQFSTNNPDPATYVWDFGDGTTGSSASPAHTYATEGTYRVCLNAQNECGASRYYCTDVIVKPVTVSCCQ